MCFKIVEIQIRILREKYLPLAGLKSKLQTKHQVARLKNAIHRITNFNKGDIHH